MQFGLHFVPFPGPSSSGDLVFGEHGRCDLSPPPSLPHKVEYDAEGLEDIKAVGLLTGLCNLMSRNKSYKTRKIN